MPQYDGNKRHMRGDFTAERGDFVAFGEAVGYQQDLKLFFLFTSKDSSKQYIANSSEFSMVLKNSSHV